MTHAHYILTPMSKHHIRAPPFEFKFLHIQKEEVSLGTRKVVLQTVCDFVRDAISARKTLHYFTPLEHQGKE